MARSKFPQARSYTPVQQAATVCSKYRGFHFEVTGRGSVKISGALRPTSLHQSYEVEITYTLGKYPKCKIIHPEIVENAPHTFDDNSICTFYPDTLIWNRTMKFSETIIPWVSDWIFHYEIWLVTKTWNGDADPRHPRRLQNAG